MAAVVTCPVLFGLVLLAILALGGKNGAAESIFPSNISGDGHVFCQEDLAR